ncbi:MAG: C4-type zinc ribbon domain-containing protein [Chitinophagales bacterium]|nr:hypothetical protein [Bacteroidota bacterium]MBK8487007.1 hypothetical protein [Bacteroidota bacterium]
MAVAELTVKESLQALNKLQKIHSKIDEITVLKGELPMEVSDLDDEITGLDTRMKNLDAELKLIESDIADRKNSIIQSKDLIKKYEKQQANVKNSREYDALTKEVEMNNLDIELNEKKILAASTTKELKIQIQEQSKEELVVKQKELKKKKEELEHIIADTEKEEADFQKKVAKAEKDLDPQVLAAYYRIRNNYRNGLAVVNVERNSCGGCFAVVPPQVQSEIKQAKKIIICEHCGRILMDDVSLES